MSRTPSAIGIRGWTVSGALALAVTFTASPAHSQDVDKADANLPAVQADDGPTVADGTAEVRMTRGAERALKQGGGWSALERGLEVRWDGERPVEAEVRAGLVTADGREVDSRILDSVTLEPGAAPVAAKQIVFVPDPETVVPAAAHSPDETYWPQPDDWFPDPSDWFPAPDDWHPNPDNWYPNPDNWDGGGPARFLVVTVVPTDPAARGQLAVRPLIVVLGARGQAAPSDKPDR